MADRIKRPAALWLYTGGIYLFVFAPIAASFVFSLNADRFPTLPLGGFSLDWYARVFTDPAVWEAFSHSALAALATGVLATFLGFGAAYTDYRYKFFGKSAYLAIALLPPTVPVIVLGLSMLAYLSRLALSGALYSIVIAHAVLCAPFAMAIIRLRLSQMDSALEAASWNLGAGPWRAMRHVVLPFAAPSLVSALFLTMAISFDEYAIAWFVSGLNETVPVRVLSILQGSVSPEINAIGGIVFLTSILLVVAAQVVHLRSSRRDARSARTGD